MSHCIRPLHLIIHSSELLILPPLFALCIHVHNLLLIYQCHTLLLSCLIADLFLKPLHNPLLLCKQHHRREIPLLLCMYSLILLLCYSFPGEPPVHQFVVNNDLELIDAPARCLRVVPQSDRTQRLRLIEPDAHEIRHSVALQKLLGSCCSCKGRSLVRPGVFEGRKPHIVLIMCLIITVREVLDDSNIISHTLQEMHALRLSTNVAVL